MEKGTELPPLFRSDLFNEVREKRHFASPPATFQSLSAPSDRLQAVFSVMPTQVGVMWHVWLGYDGGHLFMLTFIICITLQRNA